MNLSTTVESAARAAIAADDYPSQPSWRLLALRHHPKAVGHARRAVQTALDDWGVAEDAGYAVVLVASELVTNAVEHARGPLALYMCRESDQSVWVGVSDGGPARSVDRRPSSPAPEEHGRGIAIIEALATSSGHCTQSSGTTHWARLPAP
jgi:anti-sigma regulatory factor (Ser/Thr protein kinase)